MVLYVNEAAQCDLCGLPVTDETFFLETAGKRLRFCCEGCKGIYTLLHELEEQPRQTDSPERGEKP